MGVFVASQNAIMITEIYSWIEQLSWSVAALLFLMGIAAFIFSTVAGGGGALLLVPFLQYSIGTTHSAAVLNFGTFLSRPSRLILFWKDIYWRLCLYYVPPALLGAWLGAWFFEEASLEVLQIVVGLFLISTVFQYQFGKKERSFEVKDWYFIPLGLIVSVLGTIIGALGPVLNPFYLNAGLDKERLIATKTANSFFMGLAQLSSYSFFGLLKNEYWLYGLILGFGATVGNIIGKQFLKKMKAKTFRRLLLLLMVISGLSLIVKQLDLW